MKRKVDANGHRNLFHVILYEYQVVASYPQRIFTHTNNVRSVCMFNSSCIIHMYKEQKKDKNV